MLLSSASLCVLDRYTRSKFVSAVSAPMAGKRTIAAVEEAEGEVRADTNVDLRRLLEGHVANMSASLTAVNSLLKQAPSKQAPAAEASGGSAAPTPDDEACVSLHVLRDQLRAFAVERDWDQVRT